MIKLKIENLPFSVTKILIDGVSCRRSFCIGCRIICIECRIVCIGYRMRCFQCIMNCIGCRMNCFRINLIGFGSRILVHKSIAGGVEHGPMPARLLHPKDLAEQDPCL